MAWHLHLDVIVVVLLLCGAYFYGLARFQPGPRWLHPIEPRQLVLFSLGLLVLVLLQGTPYHDLSERSFSVHMVQHMVLTLVVAPLLLLGVPTWLLRPLLLRRFIFPVARFLTHPVAAIAVFTAVIVFWHLPLVYDLALWSHKLHLVNHWMYIAAALLLWWPVLSPVPELPRLSYPVQMLYLFIQSLVPAILASIITFSDTVVYVAYATAPPLWGMSPLEDQQIGGLIMKILGGVILWSAAGFIFFRWFNQEETEVEKSWD